MKELSPIIIANVKLKDSMVKLDQNPRRIELQKVQRVLYFVPRRRVYYTIKNKKIT